VNDVRRAARFLAPVALLVAALVLGSAGPAAAATPAPTAPQVLELGKGPTVVLVHDLGGSRMSWLPTARKLSASRHVVLVDLPGHGGSALPDPFTMEAAAQALDLVLAKLNPDSTVLVGAGMGGMLLLQDLKVHPDRARGLVLIDAALKWTGGAGMDAETVKWLNSMLDEHYDDFIKMSYGHAGRDSIEGLRLRALVAQVPPATMKAYLRSIFTADVSGAYKSLGFPTLFVATDRVFKGLGDKEQDWPTVAKLIGFDDPASVPLRRISGSSTLVMQDMPDSLAAVLGDFSARALAAKK